MSYEGYVQRLCAKGHYHTTDCYTEDEADRCPDCGSPFVFRNGVNQTNDDGERFVMKFEVDTPAVTTTCKCCGHTKVLEPIRYKIPKKMGET